MTKKELIADIKRKCGKKYSMYFDDPELYDEKCIVERYEAKTNNKIEESVVFDNDKMLCADMIVDAYLNEE